MKRPLARMDCEVFRDYFLCKWELEGSGVRFDFEMYAGHPLDVATLRRFVAMHTAVTFNGLNYDEVILQAALAGYNCEQLKYLSDAIIQRGMRPWEAMREFNIPRCWDIDMIDTREIAPGMASLKIYGGKMHSGKLQDLPYPHTASIEPHMRSVVREYCANDLVTTGELKQLFAVQFELRDMLSARYGVDLRSKSDAQCAEAAYKKLIGGKPEVPFYPAGTVLHYQTPRFVYFQTAELQALQREIEATQFCIGLKGTVQLPEALKERVVVVGGNSFTVRIGGLHSREKVQYHVAGADYLLTDFDVTGYYPKTMLQLGMWPSQLGPVFQRIFSDWYDERTELKRSGQKKKADTFKILQNGTFGKTHQPGSIFYSPEFFLHIVITGQLALLMLIEACAINGMMCVSANTDGVVIKCRPDQRALRDAVVTWWQQATGYALEGNDYAAIFIRDVNSYVAFKPDGEAKKKGEFADPVPVASSWPNPECQISVDAMVNYLRNGTSIEQTVRECRDVRQFVAVRKVDKGGGSFQGIPLGRAVRWYYSTRGDCIRYTESGNLVANSEGCRPMMDLMATLPDDLDFDYYITRAKRMLLTVGVTFAT